MTIHAVNNAKACAHCGAPITGQRSTRRYCGDACRQAHHRGDPVKDWRTCIAVECIGDGLIPPWMRADAEYCGPACRNHDYYAYGGAPIPVAALAGVVALADEETPT